MNSGVAFALEWQGSFPWRRRSAASVVSIRRAALGSIAQAVPSFGSIGAAMDDHLDWNNPEIRTFVHGVLQHKGQAAAHQEDTITRWLFTVNAGGIVGVLTYLASQTDPASGNWSFLWSLIALFVGLVFVVLYRAVMFYWLFHQYQVVMGQKDDLATGRSNFGDFRRYYRSLPYRNRLAETFCWLSGICAIVGGVLGACGIWSGLG